MKVAIVYPIEFGARGYFGGGERYAYELARSLATRVDCRLVVAGAHRSSRREGVLRIETHRALVEESYYNPVAPGIVASIADVDVVHCLAYGTLVTDLAVLASRMLRKKVFITDVAGRAKWSLVRYANIARFANGLLPISEFSSSSSSSVRPHRVIHGGVDPGRYSPGSPTDRSQVVYVGRLLPQKGINYLITAVARDQPLVIIGRPYNDAYYGLLRDLATGKQVRFVTDAGDDEVVAELRRSAVAVLPSVYDDCYGVHHPLTELFGLSAVEAMSCETPVICTNVGSLPELVEDGVTGLLVSPNDPDALRRAIERIRSDPDVAREMGRAARHRVLESFTWDRVAETCLRAYREMS